MRAPLVAREEYRRKRPRLAVSGALRSCRRSYGAANGRTSVESLIRYRATASRPLAVVGCCSSMKRVTRPSGNLPAEVTSFVGRRAELAELRTKLGAARLVSLVGPGGVGKTRLAIRIATELGRHFSGGAWLV